MAFVAAGRDEAAGYIPPLSVAGSGAILLLAQERETSGMGGAAFPGADSGRMRKV